MKDRKVTASEALDVLLETISCAEHGTEFSNPELEFFCRYVIENSDDQSIRAMWAEYSRVFHEDDAG